MTKQEETAQQLISELQQLKEKITKIDPPKTEVKNELKTEDTPCPKGKSDEVTPKPAEIESTKI